jgi:hypothetical protein
MDHPISINWSCSSPLCDPSMHQTLFFHPPTCRLRDVVRSLPLRNALAPNISLAPLDSACFDLTLHLSASDSLQLAAGAVRCLRIATNFFTHGGNSSSVSSGGIVTVLWDGWPSNGGVILDEGKIFFLFSNVESGPGTHKNSCWVDNGGCFPGVAT